LESNVPVLNIVEPTLRSKAGHCYSFLKSLAKAKELGRHSVEVTVWAGREIDHAGLEDLGVTIIPYFSRRFRRIQAFLLYRSLLRRPGRIFIQTAGRTDLFLLHKARRGSIQPGKVFLYFHWLKMNSGKESFFRKMAIRQPELSILSPVNSVSEQFLALGFTSVTQVPYPVTPLPKASRKTEFRHVLYAGSARKDKGFGKVVDLIEYMAANHLEVPITIQASPDHYNRYDDITRMDMARLDDMDFPGLNILSMTLGEEKYGALFRGGICLQPYRKDDFVDRVSGVTLDALSNGCPIVTTEGTWMARMVDRFGAGIVLENTSPEDLLDAVDKIRMDYSNFRDRASEAGHTLNGENSASHLFNLLTEGL